MSEIPDDIMEAARECASPWPALAGRIAAALKAERDKATEAERKVCVGVIRACVAGVVAKGGSDREVFLLNGLAEIVNRNFDHPMFQDDDASATIRGQP